MNTSPDELITAPPRRPLFGRLAVIAGWLLYLPSFALYFVGAALVLSLEEVISGLILLGLGFAWDRTLGKMGGRLWAVGRSLAAPSARELLQRRHDKNYVLYLRSFSEDSYEHEFMFITMEERLCHALSLISPVMALGKAGEKFAPVGACRLYLHDEAWQSTALTLMKRAKLIFIRVAETPSVIWEIRAALENVELERVVLLIDAYQAEDRDRLYGIVVTELARAGYRSPADSVGDGIFVWFKDGTPELCLRVMSTQVEHKESDIGWDVEETMTPVYLKLLGAKPSALTRSWRIRYITSMALALICTDQMAKIGVSILV